ncbi:fimbrial protein [Serratia marcescens]|uniref:fimbrial protein n=1 Tax=Serratia marcescens TaxID=615 RepID=UPI003ED99C21
MGKKMKQEMKQEMKARRQQGIRRIVLLGALGQLFAASATLAATSATVTITGKVISECRVEMPSTINMPDIPFSALDKRIPGLVLAEYRTTLKITGSCTGGAKFKYTLTPNDWTYVNGCIDPAGAGKDVLYICVYDPGGSRLDFTNSRTPTITNLNNGDVELPIYASVGKAPKAGAYSASLTVKIDPL